MQPRLLSEPLRRASGPLLRLQTDERLVALARAGSHPAFAEVVHRYRPALVRYTGRLVGNDRAEDVVQQGLASAHTALMSDERPIDLKPWLYRIVHNGALNVLRGERDVVTLDEHEGDRLVPGVEAQVEEREWFRSVIGAVQALPTAQRDALLLRELEGRSHEEIASALGVTAGAARQHLMRARATMRAAVTAVTPYPLALKIAALGAGAGAGAAGLPAAGALTGAGAGFSLSKLGAGVLAAGALAGGAGVVVPAIVPGPRIARTESTERARPAVSPASGARVSSTAPAARGAASRTLSSATGGVGRRARDSRARSHRREDDASEREGRSGRQAGGQDERRDPRTTSPSRDEGGHGGASHAGGDQADDDRHDRLPASRHGSSGSDSSGPGSGSSGSDSSGSGDSGSGHSGPGDSGSGSGSGRRGSGSGDLSPSSSSGSDTSHSGPGGSGSHDDADDRSGSGDGDATP